MSKVSKIVQELVTKFNREISPGQKHCEWYPLRIYEPSTIWTRGDGVRYKELGRITPAYKDDGNTDGFVAKRLFFYWLLRQPGVKYLGKITDAVRTIDPGHAVIYKGVMFINRTHFTEFGSKSRLKNSSIWRLVND